MYFLKNLHMKGRDLFVLIHASLVIALVVFAEQLPLRCLSIFSRD